MQLFQIFLSDKIRFKVSISKYPEFYPPSITIKSQEIMQNFEGRFLYIFQKLKTIIIKIRAKIKEN